MSKKKAGGLLHVLAMMVQGVVAGANLMVIAVLLLCGLCTYVSPGTLPLLGLFCLAYPLLVIANLLFVPVWLLLRPRYVLIPVVGALLSCGFTQSYSPLRLPGGGGDTTVWQMRMMTFNPHCFAGFADTTYSLFDVLRRDTFDLVCIQEGHVMGDRRDLLDATMRGFGLEPVIADARHASSVVYTRLPMVSADTLATPTEKENHSVACRLLMPTGDTLTVVNVYLESFCLNEPDKDQYRGALNSLNSDSAKQTGRYLVRQMRPKMKMHGPQTDTIMAYIRPLVEAGQPVVVCGDFNDTPVSYACQSLRSLLTDAYRSGGFGPGFTYHEKAMPFRIDHIFASDRFVPLKAQVETTVFESDHYPLTAILGVLPKKEGARD